MIAKATKGGTEMNSKAGSSEQLALVPVNAAAADTRLALLQQAISDPACDPNKLRQLLDVQLTWEANEQRKAFAADYAAFRAECPIIEPLDQGDKAHYAKLDRIERTIRPIESKYGLAILWNDVRLSDEGKQCLLRGILTHRSGYNQPVAYDAPIPEPIINREGKQIGNSTQRMGSATTYGKRYGKLAIYDLVCGVDNDGSGANASQRVSSEQVTTIRSLLKAKSRSEDQLCAWAGVKTLADLSADKFAEALEVLNGVKR